MSFPKSATAFAFLLLGLPSFSAAGPELSVVKVYCTQSRPDYFNPWRMLPPASVTGTAFYIGEGRFLTNAHVVADAAYVQLRQEGRADKVEARVLAVGHECDLALVEARDPAFAKGLPALGLGGLPRLGETVITYGYPAGGDRISFTKGVVSRIELGTYAHSGKKSLLQIQTDAAINPGNSGGPVVQGSKVAGVAFQTFRDLDNVGYMIPIPVVQHFLDDVKDGSYDGFPGLGILWRNLENEAQRRSLGLPENRSGVLITHVLAGAPADGFLQEGDILTRVANSPIAADGTVETQEGRLIFSDIVNRMQIGGKLSYELYRGGRAQSGELVVRSYAWPFAFYDEYDIRPGYWQAGGLLFQKLDKEYLQRWGQRWEETLDSRLLYYYNFFYYDKLDKGRKDIVLMTHVLADESNEGLALAGNEVLASVNGKAIGAMADLPEAFSKPEGGFQVIRLEGKQKPLVLRAGDLADINGRIMKRFGIPPERCLPLSKADAL